jgi:phosphoglycerol transferase MdoB-like AlkP superfamily enzyme
MTRTVLYLLAAYAVTLPSGLIEGPAGPSADLLAALKLACLAAFAWHTAAVLGERRGGAASALALAAATGLVWASLAGIWLYKVVALQPFDFLAVMFALDDARRTLVAVLGEHGVPLALGALALLVLAAGGAAWLLLRLARAASARVAPGPRVAALCFGMLTYLVAADLWHAANELVLYARWAAGRPFNLPDPLVPDYSAIAIGSKESVFIVQLESVNAHVVFQRTGDALGYRALIPQPGVETVLKEGGGVFFPLFWANGAGTNRAWESVLCAVGGNAGPPFTADPVRLARRTCLPAKLAGTGYSTVFLYAYFDLEFFNFGTFAKRAGFQDVAYGPRLMAEGDRRFAWAYDDCMFYRRAFEYLAKHGLDRRERVLAYFEVGMNHAPFFGTMKHPEAHPYSKPRDPAEHYLNAVAEQDHCLLEFWRGFQALGRDDIHLFVLPDHGMSVWGQPQLPDPYFATWLAYVPPRRRQAEFTPRVVLAPVPSQAQLFPTILELLGGRAAPASFAFALRGEPAPARYQDCHALGAPGQRLIVHRNGQRTEFHPRTGEVLTPGGQRVAADSGTFHERFGCGVP